MHPVFAKFDDDDIQDDLEVCLKGIENWQSRLAEASSQEELEKAHHKIVFCAADAGLILYREGDSNERIKQLLKDAAVHAVREHAVRPEEPETGRRRNAWSFVEALEYAIAFGDQELRNEASLVSESRYRFPLDEPETEVMRDVVQTVQTYLQKRSLEGSAVNNVLGTLRSDTAGREEVHFLLPLIEGIAGLAGNDYYAWRESIENGLAYHEEEARIGSLQSHYTAFMWLGGMALVRLGQEAGWDAELESPFLPKKLLG